MSHLAGNRHHHLLGERRQGGVKVTRQFGGLELGLAISKSLVELHRGSIRAESAAGLGQGSTFIVEPRAARSRDRYGRQSTALRARRKRKAAQDAAFARRRSSRHRVHY